MHKAPQDFAVAGALLLLGSLPSAIAHGHDAPDATSAMDMIGAHGTHIGSSSAPMQAADGMPSYFGLSEHAGLMYAHILLMILSWVVFLPVAVMLSIARSRLSFSVQAAFLIANTFGIVTSIVYNHKTPDLYENNSHHKAGWAITWIAVAWILTGILQTYARRDTVSLRPSLQPVTQQAMAEYQRLHDARKFENFRWSNDSGQGTERNTESLCGSSRTQSMNSDTGALPTRQRYGHDEEEEEEVSDSEKRSFLRNTTADRLFSRMIPRTAGARTWLILGMMHVVLERFMILLGFIGLTSGLVVYGGVFRGSNVLNGLAHFIKGGIFFCYGLLTFGRWLGSFADLGWAWNLKPPRADVMERRKISIPSAEFTESAVIAFYGASNVFLEHLAAWGEPWSPMDLEHVSITIMFFGGGLLGMMIESGRIRRMLNSALNVFENVDNTEHLPNQWQEPKSYIHSLNPIPALIIMLLGIMMSSHTQHSGVSTAIHKQWGTMFIGFALARGITYITLWLKPPESYLPSRPPSEIITSFCLISGGTIFMASNKDTVGALERYNLDGMFVFTVMMGLTALLMAWEVVVVAIKGWAVQRQRTQDFLSAPAPAA